MRRALEGTWAPGTRRPSRGARLARPTTLTDTPGGPSVTPLCGRTVGLPAHPCGVRLGALPLPPRPQGRRPSSAVSSGLTCEAQGTSSRPPVLGPALRAPPGRASSGALRSSLSRWAQGLQWPSEWGQWGLGKHISSQKDLEAGLTDIGFLLENPTCSVSELNPSGWLRSAAADPGTQGPRAGRAPGVTRSLGPAHHCPGNPISGGSTLGSRGFVPYRLLPRPCTSSKLSDMRAGGCLWPGFWPVGTATGHVALVPLQGGRTEAQRRQVTCLSYSQVRPRQDQPVSLTSTQATGHLSPHSDKRWVPGRCQGPQDPTAHRTSRGCSM